MHSVLYVTYSLNNGSHCEVSHLSSSASDATHHLVSLSKDGQHLLFDAQGAVVIPDHAHVSQSLSTNAPLTVGENTLFKTFRLDFSSLDAGAGFYILQAARCLSVDHKLIYEPMWLNRQTIVSFLSCEEEDREGFLEEHGDKPVFGIPKSDEAFTLRELWGGTLNLDSHVIDVVRDEPGGLNIYHLKGYLLDPL